MGRKLWRVAKREKQARDRLRPGWVVDARVSAKNACGRTPAVDSMRELWCVCMRACMCVYAVDGVRVVQLSRS
jgi:hypothetical protein